MTHDDQKQHVKQSGPFVELMNQEFPALHKKKRQLIDWGVLGSICYWNFLAAFLLDCSRLNGREGGAEEEE